MKNSIEHLPACTQEELNILVELIKKEVKGCEMIILYGSYSRDTFVIYDERITFGSRTVFQSDLDILVVCSLSADTDYVEYLLRRVADKYRAILKELRTKLIDSRVKRYAPPQLISEDIETLNRGLSESKSFYADLIKDGIMLYDTGNHTLSKPQKLSHERRRDIAQEEFDECIDDADEFLEHGKFSYGRGKLKLAAFMLHQSCEKYYKAINIVFDNYRPKIHDLEDLRTDVIDYSQELFTLFPRHRSPIRESHSFEERCYDLLIRAYIESRYNPNFMIIKEEYEYMLKKSEELKEITMRICTEQIKAYDLLIEVNKSKK
jgi:HEPN domain-containing protein/predicted nucleotidyltransferase